jgi:hypothetical protein
MIGGGLWSPNPSLTGSIGVYIRGFGFSTFRTNDLLDKSSNGNQTDLSITYGKRFGNWKITLANDILLFDNKSSDMLIPRVIATYSTRNFSIEGTITYCSMFKGESMSIVRLSPTITMEGYSFRLFLWEKYSNKKYTTPIALQIGKKLIQFSNGTTLSMDVTYHLKDITTKDLESFGYCSMSFNF